MERVMPYYVYAIHTDEQSNNRLYKIFDAFREASDFEREMSDANFPHDNYFVKMFFADDEATAAAKADAMRPFPKGAGKA
jgi:hypothetical protein